MSARNGDRARFQKDRKRKMLHRQRIRQLRRTLRESALGRAGGEPKAGEQDNSQQVRS